ncbi:MAG: CRISPR-associated helicase Cas3' [Leptospiraceae bacterium]|nr:CRISPR-associated helicase Cas3' [Leptospiraceae bacterium]
MLEKIHLKRIIIVLPYTNIIDQTSKELKEIFGNDVVLEHHSGVSENEDDELKYDPKKLATENWDYPIIVTTTVQFFESIFSNRPSKCRKLHNIADSVVIFDEVQTLPKESIKPTLRMIYDIQKVFNTSFLFCTATMPAFQKKKGIGSGLDDIEPLIKDTFTLFEKTKRVEYSFVNELEEIDQDNLIQRIGNSSHSVLIIFNSKKDALNIFRAIERYEWDKIFHLSTSMCAHHRKAILAEIKECLSAGMRILTVSTQLVEAGVDFDFPIVYRAIAPLDSIIQAAGRCNREGKLKDENGNPLLGKVFVFRMANMGMPYDSAYKTATEFTVTYLKDKKDRLSSPEIYTEYYRTLLNLFLNEDKANIDESRKNLEFKNVAERYKIIDSPAMSVFISEYNSESKDLLDEMNATKFISQSVYRRMQPYLVQLYPI